MSMLDHLKKQMKLPDKKEISEGKNEVEIKDSERKIFRAKNEMMSVRQLEDGEEIIPEIVFTADWHLYRRQYNLKRRIDDIYDSCRQVVLKAKERGEPLLVHGGDLFHKNVARPKALNQAMDLLNEYGHNSKVLAIRGNHDGTRISAERGDTLLHSLQFAHLLTYVERGIYDYYTDDYWFRFFCISYYGRETMKRLKEVVDECWDAEPFLDCSGKKRVDILVTHGLVDTMGIPVDHCEYISSELAEYEFDLVLMGHYHKKFLDLDNRIFVTGSPETMDIGDVQDSRGYWAFGFVNDELVYWYEPIETSTFFDIEIDTGEVDIETCISRCKMDIESRELDGSFVRVTISGRLTDAFADDFPIDDIRKMVSSRGAFYVIGVVNKLTDEMSSESGSSDGEIVDEKTALSEILGEMVDVSDLEVFVESVIDIKNELVSGKKGKEEIVAEWIGKLVLGDY
jgi:DNA repair exonuclease SbcCD nuclease subunit